MNTILSRREMMMGLTGMTLFAASSLPEKLFASLADDAAKKKFFIEECGLKFDHFAMPALEDMKFDAYLPELKIHITEYENDPFGIEWIKFEEGCPLPKIIQTRPHVAFVVNDIEKAMQGYEPIVKLGNPRPGMRTAFIEHKGLPVEFVERTPVK